MEGNGGKQIQTLACCSNPIRSNEASKGDVKEDAEILAFMPTSTTASSTLTQLPFLSYVHRIQSILPPILAQSQPSPMSTATGNAGAGLPTHHAKPPIPKTRRTLCCCLLAVLLVLAITLLVLFLTVLRVRDPTTRLVSTRLAGVVPRLSFPSISLTLNVTLLLTVSVHNPNPASFTYASGGHTDLSYRGAHVGDAEIAPGRIPSRGDGTVQLALTLQADRFVAGKDMAQLVADVEAGALALDASTRIPGRVAVFGVFKRHAVAYSDCHFVFGIADMRVQSQKCSDRTKL